MSRTASILQLLILCSSLAKSSFAWIAPSVPLIATTRNTIQPLRAARRRALFMSLSSTPSPSSTMTTSTTPATTEERKIVAKSSLLLLEHVNINIPSHEHIDFYLNLLNLGLDPRKAGNVMNNNETSSKTLWANAGVSQFHLPYGETAQVIPGHVGLTFRNLQQLRNRMQQFPSSFQSAVETIDARTNVTVMTLTDHYGNVFKCRQQQSLIMTDSDYQLQPQPIVGTSESDVATRGADLFARYGKTISDCTGISYLEFNCPVETAAVIANFYEHVLGAATTVMSDANTTVAIIAIGQIDEHGRSDQSLVFRETSEPLPPYDGHHVALYVGESPSAFDQAYMNCEQANVIWVNPRFSDAANTIEAARHCKQFRFKDIVNLNTGQVVYELEHEVRSMEHECWTATVENTCIN
ncbi:hypothetical protein MPSEU_000764000 [Mayamaea pseudoterrestris]|nr:hypothetical protein MPSEU_000764000 [Mayamaea pseudoterrestris]